MDTLTSAQPTQVGEPTRRPDEGEQHEPTQGLTIDQAAVRLGLSVTTVRRRIKLGKLRAELVAGDHGPEYRVQLGPIAVARVVTTPDEAAGQGEQPSVGTDQAPMASLVALVDRLTREAAKLHDERAELYGRLGYLQSTVQQLQETVKALQAPAEPLEPPMPTAAADGPVIPRGIDEPSPRRRRWWPFGGG